MDAASVVISALENFVLPIVRAQMLMPDANLIIDDEARALVIALKKFVAALVRSGHGSSYLAQKEKEGREGEDDEPKAESLKISSPISEGTSASLNSLVIANALATSMLQPSPRTYLLHKAMDAMRHHIFNQLPIRLLAFDGENSEFELVERNEIWSRISTQMQRDFHQKFNFPGNTMPMNPNEAEAILQFDSRYLKFAILSHTWIQDTPGEVTYTDWKAGNVDRDSIGYRKLANFCKVAANNYSVNFAWMDTICINKDSSSELDESIRSRFNWYSSASICVTYLAGTLALQDMRYDPWFTRGWTLQELLASRHIKFYNANWQKIYEDSENDLQNDLIVGEIRAATTIQKDELKRSISSISLSRKMQWAANRQVTRAEDTAYSLMGIFGVIIPTAYGEGSERAFVRLLKEILISGKHVLELANFGFGYEFPTDEAIHRSISSLIASSPKQYLLAAHGIVWPLPAAPVTLTHLGLRISVLLMPGFRIDSSSTTAWSPPFGRYHSTATVEFLHPQNTTIHSTYRILDQSVYTTSSTRDEKLNTRGILFFGVLNFYEKPTTVQLQRGNLCYAKVLQFKASQTDFGTLVSESLTQQRVLLTTQPVVFALQPVADEITNYTSSIKIPKNELGKHGMYLRTMYL